MTSKASMTTPAHKTGRTDQGPERIFATVNGMSTRLPDGGRQFIGGWSQDRDRPRSIEYVRGDISTELTTALEAMIAEFSSAEHRDCGCVSCRTIRTARTALSASRSTGDQS